MTKSTSLFIETLFIKDGHPLHLKWHQQRVNNTFNKFFQNTQPFLIEERVNNLPLSLQKCKITYSEKIESIEFEPFIPKQINSLRIVESEPFDYAYKYADRATLNQLRERREDCDDILISINGYIKDTSFANVVLFDGEQYFTPDPPLLYGTKRAQLLELAVIKALPIRTSDLHLFKELHMINALANLGDYVINIDKIF